MLTVVFEDWQKCTVILSEVIMYCITPNKMRIVFQFYLAVFIIVLWKRDNVNNASFYTN